MYEAFGVYIPPPPPVVTLVAVSVSCWRMPVVFWRIPAVFCSTAASEVTLPGTVMTALPPPNCAEADMGMSSELNRSPIAIFTFIDKPRRR